MTVPSRTPAVSGTFYPSLPGRLRADVRGYLEAAQRAPRRAAGVLAPHAGFTYSGLTAGAAFAAVEVPGTCVILAPNHTGRATSAEGGSLLLDCAYRTPLGDLPVDAELGAAIRDRAAPLLAEDLIAHSEEHAVEVLLPFLQLRNPDVRIVPIVIGWVDWPRTARLARAIHDASPEPNDVLVVASSDMNHYEPANVTADKDTIALDQIITLDGEGFLTVTREHRISVCGRVPVACALEVARLRGKRTGEVVGYSHSGLVNGNNDRVVGYAAALLGPE